MPLESFSVALQRVAVARMVRQLSDVYSVVRVSTMSELAPFIAFGQVRHRFSNPGSLLLFMPALSYPTCPLLLHPARGCASHHLHTLAVCFAWCRLSR